jgi:hypothetical protein
MSISTLKKKTNTLYNNMSVNKVGFSLNGGCRNQGYIGQTSLSRSLPRTLMKGGELKGSGGCCGTYLRTPIIQSSLNYQNNSSVIKSSSINNMGMLLSKHRWIRRPQPFSCVKPDNNNIITQSDIISNKKQKSIYNTENCINPPVNNTPCISNLPNNKKPNTNNVISNNDILNQKKYLQQSHYIENRFHAGCIQNDIKPVNSTKNTPFSCGSK